MEVRKTLIKNIKPNPNNPRIIKDDKFEKLVQSIKDFPDMLDIRPIVVNKDMIVLGGNMRLKACIEAKLSKVPVMIVDLTEEQQKEFIIKDNVSGGEWDWNILANEWDTTQLTEWGLDIPNFEVDEVDDLSSDIKSLYKIEISFKNEESQEIGYNKLLEQGYECRLLTL